MGCRDRNHCQKRSARSVTEVPTRRSVTEALRFSAEERQLFRLALDLGVKPEQWAKLVEVRFLTADEPAQVVGFEDMPVLLFERLGQQWRAAQLEANQLRALGWDDQEAHDRIIGRDARP